MVAGASADTSAEAEDTPDVAVAAVAAVAVSEDAAPVVSPVEVDTPQPVMPATIVAVIATDNTFVASEPFIFFLLYIDHPHI